MNTPVAAAQKPVANVAAASTFDQLKETTLNAVNWMGKSIQNIGSSVKQYSLKVVEWAKPFFQNLSKMVRETFDKAKTFLMENKQMSAAVGIAVFAGVLLTIFAMNLCDNNKEATGTA